MNNVTPLNKRNNASDCLDRLVERLDTVEEMLVITISEKGLIEIDSSDMTPGMKAHLSLALQAQLMEDMTERV